MVYAHAGTRRAAPFVFLRLLVEGRVASPWEAFFLLPSQDPGCPLGPLWLGLVVIVPGNF